MKRKDLHQWIGEGDVRGYATALMCAACEVQGRLDGDTCLQIAGRVMADDDDRL